MRSQTTRVGFVSTAHRAGWRHAGIWFRSVGFDHIDKLGMSRSLRWPFDNRSTDPEHSIFSDGSEDLIALLSARHPMIA